MSGQSVVETAPAQGLGAVQGVVGSIQTLPQTHQHLSPSNSSLQVQGYLSSQYPSVCSTVTPSLNKGSDVLVDAVSVLVTRIEEMIDLTRSEIQSRNPTKPLPAITHMPAASDDPRKLRRSVVWLQKVLMQRIERHWIILSVFFMATVVAVSIGAGWASRLPTFNIQDPPSAFNVSDPIVHLTANLIAINPEAQTMTMDWFANYPACTATGDPGDCPNIGIYLDEASLRTGSVRQGRPVPSNTLPPPTFFFNTTDYYLAFTDYDEDSDERFSSPVFRTILAISNLPVLDGKSKGGTLQSYPFDRYFSQIIVFAQNSADNSTVSVVIDSTYGLAVGFNAQLQSDSSGIADDFGTLIKTIVVTRGEVVRAYAILVVAAVWLVTLTFIGVCIASVFCGKGLSASVLTLPVVTLYAFTQLRGTLPGAPPGFGASIDFVGVLPCLVLLTFCSVFMTALFLFRNPEVDSERWARIRAVCSDKAAQAECGMPSKED